MPLTSLGPGMLSHRYPEGGLMDGGFSSFVPLLTATMASIWGL